MFVYQSRHLANSILILILDVCNSSTRQRMDVLDVWTSTYFVHSPVSRATPGTSSSILYIKEDLCVCGLCNTNGRPNDSPDLDENFGMDSHLPSG